MSFAKLSQVAAVWALSLGLSALLVAAGQRWPQPPELRPALVWSLVWLPPLVMALWLVGRWRLPGAGQEGESVDPAQETL